MPGFPIATLDEWEALGLSEHDREMVQEAAEIALTGLSGEVASVEVMGLGVSEGLPLIRARLRVSGLPDMQVWERTVDLSVLAAGGIDLAASSATYDIGVVLHDDVVDFVAERRSQAVQRYL